MRADLAAAQTDLADATGLIRSLATWVGVPDDTPLLDITCEVSAALEPAMKGRSS